MGSLKITENSCLLSSPEMKTTAAKSMDKIANFILKFTKDVFLLKGQELITIMYQMHPTFIVDLSQNLTNYTINLVYLSNFIIVQCSVLEFSPKNKHT